MAICLRTNLVFFAWVISGSLCYAGSVNMQLVKLPDEYLKKLKPAEIRFWDSVLTPFANIAESAFSKFSDLQIKWVDDNFPGDKIGFGFVNQYLKDAAGIKKFKKFILLKGKNKEKESECNRSLMWYGKDLAYASFSIEMPAPLPDSLGWAYLAIQFREESKRSQQADMRKMYMRSFVERGARLKNKAVHYPKEWLDTALTNQSVPFSSVYPHPTVPLSYHQINRMVWTDKGCSCVVLFRFPQSDFTYRFVAFDFTDGSWLAQMQRRKAEIDEDEYFDPATITTEVFQRFAEQVE